MREIGIRTLKNEASAIVRSAEAGETVVVTRNGKPVARLVPEGMPAGVESLVASGRASWSGRSVSVPRSSVQISDAPTLAETVLADRGER